MESLSASMTHEYTVQLVSPFSFNKVEEVLEVEGVILAPGTFTDYEGKTIRVKPSVIKSCASSFVAVPLVIRHTDEKEDILKVVGFSNRTWIDSDGKLRYKGIVYKPDAIRDIELGEKNAHSIEAKLYSEWNPAIGAEDASNLIGEAIAFTTADRAACNVCLIHGHRLKKSVQLEKRMGGGKMPEEGEEVPVEPEEEEIEEPVTEEAFMEKLRELVMQYPMPKGTPWDKMSDAQKKTSCVAFFKHKGIKYPYPKPAKGEVAFDAPTMKAFAYAMKAAGISEDKVKAAIQKLQQKYPYPAKAEQLGEEIDAMLAVQTENEAMKAEIERLKEAKLQEEFNAIVNSIKGEDKSFDDKSFFDKIECTEKKIDLAKRYKTQLERMKKPLTLTAVSDVQLNTVENLSVKEFGGTPEDLLKEIVPEAFQKKEGQ